jgi:hypothetical protein
MSDIEVTERTAGGTFFVTQDYDLSVFAEVPATGPYSSLQQAEDAAAVIRDLVSGATPD